jgi:hypothetical protein
VRTDTPDPTTGVLDEVVPDLAEPLDQIGDERSEASDRSDRSDPSDRGLDRWVVASAIVAGVVLRAIILLTPLGRPDSDEVIPALMIRNIADDGFPTFFWGQFYGGTVEVIPVMASMKLFGWSIGAMRVPTIILVAVNALLVWRLGRHWLTERQAQLAALLVWVTPPAAMWLGVREQLFYVPTVTLGLVMALAAYRVRERGGVLGYAVIGATVGLGIWTSSNIAYFVVPAAFVALGGERKPTSRVREVLVGAPVAVVAALLAAYPFVRAYLETDGAPMRVAEKFPVIGTYWSRFGYFFVEALPGALGLRAMYTHDWIGGALGVVAYLAILGLLGWSLARSWPSRGRVVGWAAIALVAYPFVYAAIPFVTDDRNLRYTSFAVPALALVLVRLVNAQRVAIAALAVAVLVTGVGLQRQYVISEVEDSGYKVGNVGELVTLIDALDREGITEIYTDYWVAYRGAVETQERIVAATTAGIPRYPPYFDVVGASSRSAWVVDSGHQLELFEQALDDLGVGYRVVPADEWSIVVPERHVAPWDVPEDARRPW